MVMLRSGEELWFDYLNSCCSLSVLVLAHAGLAITYMVISSLMSYEKMCKSSFSSLPRQNILSLSAVAPFLWLFFNYPRYSSLSWRMVFKFEVLIFKSPIATDLIFNTSRNFSGGIYLFLSLSAWKSASKSNGSLMTHTGSL